MKYQSKQITEVYDEISTSYAVKFNEPSDNIDDFLKLIGRGGKILDSGCGPGVDVTYIASRGFDVIGVDLSEKMLEIAKRKVQTQDLKKQTYENLILTKTTLTEFLLLIHLFTFPKKISRI